MIVKIVTRRPAQAAPSAGVSAALNTLLLLFRTLRVGSSVGSVRALPALTYGFLLTIRTTTIDN